MEDEWRVRRCSRVIPVPIPEIWDSRFHMYDANTAEVETLELIASFIRRTLPEVVVECGTYKGIGAMHLGLALHENAAGHLYTIEHDDGLADVAVRRMRDEGVEHVVTVLRGKTTEVDLPFSSCGLIFHDADRHFEPQQAEFDRFWPLLKPGGFAFVHDTSIYSDAPEFRVVDNCSMSAERHGMVHMRIGSSRGLEILQKRSK